MKRATLLLVALVALAAPTLAQEGPRLPWTLEEIREAWKDGCRGEFSFEQVAGERSVRMSARYEYRVRDAESFDERKTVLDAAGNVAGKGERIGRFEEFAAILEGDSVEVGSPGPIEALGRTLECVPYRVSKGDAVFTYWFSEELPGITVRFTAVQGEATTTVAVTALEFGSPAILEDATRAAGLAGVPSPRVSFADLDGDGDPDAVIGTVRVFLNEGGRFVETPAAATLAPEGKRRPDCVQVGDVDGDGFADLFLGRYTDLSSESFQDDGLRSEIWLGDGKGGFRKVEDPGFGNRAETTISATFVDFDADGRLDLFVGNAYTAYGKSLEAFPDRLYRGKGDGTFEDVTEKAGLLGVAEPGRADSRRPTYGVAHTDWNQDGRQDLLALSYGRQWNRLWKNQGDGTFVDVGPETGFDGDEDRTGTYPPRIDREAEAPFRSNGNTFDSAVADFDGDGDMDVFLAEITHWWAGSSSDLSMLLVNQGAEHGFRFRRDPARIVRRHEVAGWNQGDLHAGWLDIDNDGRLDLLVASSDYPDDQLLRLYHQEADGSFEEWTDRLGVRWMNASQISLADFDRDGATDILVGTSHMRLTPEQRERRDLGAGLFRNTLPARLGNRFLSLRLDGQAVGARVVIEIAGRRQTREVHGGLGHAGHRDDAECRFGAGQAEVVDRLEVRWPDAGGTVQVFEKVPTNRFYRLARGGDLR